MADAFDCIIKNATVYDGTGAPGVAADVAIAGSRIAAVGNLSAARSKTTIDAAGMALSPGFIDAHTHSDLPSLLAPLAESRLYAGVTTEICGNCGYAAGPFRDPGGEHFPEKYEGLDITWHTQGEFFSRLEDVGSAVNRAFLAGHGNIRRTAMGGDLERSATSEEIAEMRRLLRAEIKAGAIGMSTGLIYPPGCFASKEEIAEVAAVLGEEGLIYASHVRDEADFLIEALDEALFIAETARCRCQISHLKIYEERNWHKIDTLRRWWNARTKREVPVTADRYPYTASHTLLDSILPQWAFVDGPAATLDRLRSNTEWARIREELLARAAAPLGETITVSTTFSSANKPFEGKMLADVAGEMDLEPVDAVRALLLADDRRTMAVFFKMSEANMIEILSWPDVLVGSDSGVRGVSGPTAEGFPHPRFYGTTGKIFRLLVREKKALDLPTAIAKMTGRVAEVFSLDSRGKIKEGFAADLAVFDPSLIADTATYQEPRSFTTGVKYLFVNGTMVLQDGKVTGKKPGRLLRHT